MSSSMRYRDRRQQKEDAPIQFERAVTGLWIILMFVVFPLIVHDAYFDLLETKFKTFVVQAAAPALAVLPILASHGDGDVEFSTNVVTLSTILFVVVIPIVVTLLG